MTTGPIVGEASERAGSHIRPDRTGSPWIQRPGQVVLLVAVAAGVLLRIWMLGHYAGALDSDEAVVGLMARHILHGQFPVFYWGQQYGGSLEAFITAALFGLFGTSSLTLKLVPLGLDAVAALLVWRVGRRTIDEPAARVAAALFWIWPAAFVWSSVKAEGFYGVALVAALLILLLVLRLREGGRTRDWLLLGLVLGIGWWSTPEIAFVALPALIWLAIRQGARFQRWLLIVPGGGAGAAPWLAWNLKHHLHSLQATPQPVPDNTYPNHLTGFTKVGLPGALSLRIPLSAHWVGSPTIGKAVYVVAVILLVGAAVHWRHQLDLLLFVALAYPFLLALSPYSWYLDDPRYLLLLSPAIALTAAGLLTRWLSVGAATLAAAVALSIIGIRGIPVALPYPQSFAPLIHALDAHGVNRAFGDYWVAYRLDFETKERIIASPISPIRHIPFDAEVRDRPDPAYIFLKGSLPEAQFLTQLTSLGVAYRSTFAGGFSIYVPREKVVPPAPGQPQGPVERPGPAAGP